MFGKDIFAACTALTLSSAFAGAVSAAPITYQGSDTEDNVNISYTITTNGTIGDLLLSDILASTVTFTGLAASGDYKFSSFTAYNNVYFQNTNPGGASPISATTTSLLFNFAGGGGLNMGTVNCPTINCSAYSSNSAPNDILAGLAYALAGAQSTDDDSVVYHVLGPGGPVVLPVKELDNLVLYPDFYLHAGTYTQVAATRQVIATALTEAVPEPSSWALMVLGFGSIGYTLRHRKRGEVSSLVQSGA